MFGAVSLSQGIVLFANIDLGSVTGALAPHFLDFTLQ